MTIEKLDANESAFFLRELEYIKARSRDEIYKKLKFADFIPVSTETPSGSESITWRQFSQIGSAKVISNYAKDFPRVDIYGEEFTRKIKDIGASYGYNSKEVKRSAIAGRNLNPKRSNAANRAIMQMHNTLAWTGNATYNIPGFIDYPGVQEYTVPVGAGGPKTFISKTPDEILLDLNSMITIVVDTTNGVENPNQIIMPIEQYRIISTTRLTDGDSNTILKFFLDNNPGVSVDWVVELKGAGASGTDRMMAYVKDNDHLEYDAPTIFNQLEPVREGMEYTVPVTGESAGVVVYYPLSVIFGDGI